MKLFINTTNTDKILISLDDQMFETKSKIKKTQTILPFIDEVLKANNKTINDITTIKVNTNPRSFTGIQIKVTVTQTLTWQLNIPLNGKLYSEKQQLKLNYS